MLSNTNKNSEYISLAEAARLTGISKDYFRICVQKNYLRGVKFGRNWVTTKEWVDEYLKTYRRAPTPSTTRNQSGHPMSQRLSDLRTSDVHADAVGLAWDRNTKWADLEKIRHQLKSELVG